MRYAGHVALMREKRNATGFGYESQKEIYHYEDLYVGGRTILKWILEKKEAVEWTEFICPEIRSSGGLL
jgi:hypothetical protein